ncbi:uncharacterized protein DEA37_0004691 [Paragonimus westermani]|uniref:Exonuclease domain-containing protein n=1 Tax=Paragonimus westermani TaxID=34504 RepID=A0A5J4NJK2_9TREM|nr:uncharacterized protein DEA37_0004691 [Paragonimus westermani]
MKPITAPFHMGRFVLKRYVSSFPIKCSVCYHSENITSGLLPTYGMRDDAMSTVNLCPVAIDCEMVGVGPKMLNALGRVSIVDYSGNTLYDVMVRPEEEITDFRTRWSGIRPDDMRRSIPFACAQEQVERIIHIVLWTSGSFSGPLVTEAESRGPNAEQKFLDLFPVNGRL